MSNLQNCSQIEFPLDHLEAQRQTLERLYQRKATLEALIKCLEEYARCRASAQITTFPQVREC